VPALVPQLPGTIRACLFDLDGVITDTASVHERAWKATFDAFLQARADREGTAFVPFDAGDYDEYIDGKHRFDGVRSFLESRGIELPEGTHDDPPGADTVGGLGNRKNALLLELIHRDGVRRFEDAVTFLHAVRDAGLRRAVVSASANCAEVLASVGLTALLEVRIDGIVAEREHLRGKPAPDTFLAAARALGVEPSAAMVIEDAVAGVEAGRAGAFGLVVGVDRIGSGHGEALRAHGAGVVVSALTELLGPDG
jgi:beta-phosphoglucomutase family hydrolase